ncbi:MAG: type IV pili methyl-accepting chemotaxis transducer N-terminal domain-containing protein [Candidatus Electrothrix aestuarii]|uniref:Type IV pili methyl-accepting chemotaxis transducer N-terminal domain-containing protein n=1 Tax=Candidatus Electrothrix aestuarii TaxID=3062594 RepID=A0AAU8LVB9_9BACT|nr:type IV pili methyl-accepting chemotaxis transducer N-terminal domain-containing protein [Candidatus Electrothrix aestuarii]WPD22180.1 MAG: type IV pili methyl-accepting chemotaxis transducer N-terminal domain-containing protein [Candidatus Electrothrix sp. GW3-3]
MYAFTFRIVTLLTVFFTMALTQQVQAAATSAELVNKSGMQRMLSQRIAKAYFFLGNDVSAKEAKLQLGQALERFKNNHALLKANVQDTETRDLLTFVENSFIEYRDLVKKPYSQESAGRVLELSEILLEACHSVVLNIEGSSGLHVDHVVNISGKQRMLSQRIAKFYIAYQAGFRDEDTVQKLKNAISEFETGLKKLMNEGRNNGEIDSALAKTKTEWDRISPYFLKVRKGGLPLMVLTATDEITKLADRITDLYVEKIATSK